MSADAAIRTYRLFPHVEPHILDIDRYTRMWSFWNGSWRDSPSYRRLKTTDKRLYYGTYLCYNMTRAVVDLYAQSVYQGDLSLDGEPLPDGTMGAIPIQGQGTEEQELAIKLACGQLWKAWNWTQGMSMPVKYAAILGDVLLEFHDDIERGMVYPELIWPGYVIDMQLDLVGNIQAYVIEYTVNLPKRTFYGRTLEAENYVYRKEVDKEFYRYFKNDKPHPDFGQGKETGNGNGIEPNIYGFVPACWFRHEIVPGFRGQGSFEAGLRTLEELNSVLSQALDYQRQQFAAPVGVRGAIRLPTNSRLTRLRRPLTGDEEEDVREIAEELNLLPMNKDGEFVTITFDVGKTVEMITFIQDRLLAEFPEAMFLQEILKMTQLTAPGVERALGPIIGKVKGARKNHDPQMIKAHQMPIAMIGERLKLPEGEGGYNRSLVETRRDRYDAFDAFDLGSYARGELDFILSSDREVIPETEDERIDRILKIQLIENRDLMLKAGVEPEIVDSIFTQREEKAQQELEIATGAFEDRGGE